MIYSTGRPKHLATSAPLAYTHSINDLHANVSLAWIKTFVTCSMTDVTVDKVLTIVNLDRASLQSWLNYPFNACKATSFQKFLVISVTMCGWWGVGYSGSASGATACKASGRWCVLHVNHQMFLKRATGGGEGGRRATTAGRVGWLPLGLGSHQEPWAQTADLAHTWMPRLSLGKNKVDPIYACWDKLTVVQNALTGAIPSKQAFGSNNITGRCWCDQISHNSGSVPCNKFFLFFSMHIEGIHTHLKFVTAHFCPIWRCLGTSCSFCLIFPGFTCHDWLTEWLGAGKVIFVTMVTAICPPSNPALSLNWGQLECSTPIYSLKSHHLASVPPTREQIN